MQNNWQELVEKNQWLTKENSICEGQVEDVRLKYLAYITMTFSVLRDS
jgi:hypothetical protein